MARNIESKTSIKASLVENRRWLREHMNPYFFIAMKDEQAALGILEREMGTLRHNRQLILADRDNTLVLATPNAPGSLYNTMRRFSERGISYAMIAHSDGKLPGMEQTLEIQRFEFDRKSNHEILAGNGITVPLGVRRRISGELKRS